MAPQVEIPIFIDTNMGTRIAMAVPPNISVPDFKRKLAIEHFNCFPEVGEIRVDGLMMKRKSYFYHLPESMLIKHAFQGLKRTWFLRMEGGPLNGLDSPGLSKRKAKKVKGHATNDRNVIDPLEPKNVSASNDKNNGKGKGKRRIREVHSLKSVQQELPRTDHLLEYSVIEIENKGCLDTNEETAVVTANEKIGNFASENEVKPRTECSLSSTVENPSETSSAVISVSGIIKRYFSNLNEASRFSSPSSSEVSSRPNRFKKARTEVISKKSSRVSPFPLPTEPRHGTSNDKLGRSDVGKRLVMVSNSLGIAANKKPAISHCRLKDGKFSRPLVRSIVFEISDSDSDG